MRVYHSHHVILVICIESTEQLCLKKIDLCVERFEVFQERQLGFFYLVCHGDDGKCKIYCI